MRKIKSSFVKLANGVIEFDIYLDNTYDKYKISVTDFTKKAIIKLAQLNLEDAMNEIVGVCYDYER